MHILLNIGATGISNAEGKNLKRYYEKCPDPLPDLSTTFFVVRFCGVSGLGFGGFGFRWFKSSVKS